MKKILLLIVLIVFPVLIFAQSYSPGDTNHDSTVDIVDALLIAQAYVGLDPAGYYASEGDVDCSGEVDIIDALLVAQFYVNLIEEFPCQGPTPEPTTDPGTPGPTTNSGLPTPLTSGVPKPSGNPANLVVVNWAGFKGAISYTFDDANSSQINNYSTLNGLGVPFTFYLWTNKSEASNSIWSTALSNGHELGNHTNSHQQNGTASDVDLATTFIQQHFGVKPCTFAAPYGNTSYVSIVQTRFLLSRGVNGGSISPNDSSDAFNLPCHIPAENESASTMNGYADSARNSGVWNIFCIHGFSGGSDGAYQPINLSQFTSHVNYTKSLGDVWIDSAVNVGAYWRGQKTVSSVSPATSGSDKIYSWSLPGNFPPGKYLRVKVDGGTLKQGGNVLPWDDHGYYEISLDSGSLTLSP